MTTDAVIVVDEDVRELMPNANGVEDGVSIVTTFVLVTTITIVVAISVDARRMVVEVNGTKANTNYIERERVFKRGENLANAWNVGPPAIHSPQ